ncbi:type II secretion system F family protein [Planctomycetota bacterium]
MDLEILIAFIIPAGYVLLGFYRPKWSLVSMLFVCGLLVFIGAMVESPIVAMGGVLLIPITLLAALISLLRRGSKTSVPRDVPQIVARIVIALLFFMTLVTLAMAELWPLVFVFMIVGFIFTFVYTLLHAPGSKVALQTTVLSTLAACTRQNLPLAPALEMAAQGYRGRVAATLRHISHWLTSGSSVTEALRYGYPQCPVDILAAVGVAEPIHQLPRALESVQAELTYQARQRRHGNPTNFTYPFTVLTVAVVIAFGLMKFVLPQYKSIMEELLTAGPAQFPATTRLLLDIAQWLMHDAWLIPIGILLLYVLGLPLRIYFRFRARRSQQPYISSKLADIVKWYLPIVHGFERNRSQRRVIEQLRLALCADCPLPDAVNQCLTLDINYVYRRRLQRWMLALENGAPIAPAAKRHHLGSSLVWAFDRGGQQSSTPEILHTLATLLRCNYQYRINLLRSMLEPSIILVLALSVGFIAHAMYSPMIAILDHFSHIYP